jgi:hypothetical protein
VTFVYNLILVLHFIGLASVVGGFLVQMKSLDKGVNPAMLHGALTQLVTGVLMVGIVESGIYLPYEGFTIDNAKIGVKLLLTVVITVLAFVGRKRVAPQVGLWGAIGGLSIVNILIAVFWS